MCSYACLLSKVFCFDFFTFMLNRDMEWQFLECKAGCSVMCLLHSNQPFWLTVGKKKWVSNHSLSRLAQGQKTNIVSFIILILHLHLSAMKRSSSIFNLYNFHCSYELKEDEEEQIARLAEDGDLYNKLARSLAPEIFGHEDIKRLCFSFLLEPLTGSWRMGWR